VVYATSSPIACEYVIRSRGIGIPCSEAIRN
jgi:hypothetical protein